jgi:DUF1680 family protein
VNGKTADVEVRPGTFAVIRRSWQAGDVVALALPMEARLLTGHPRIEEVRNQAAIQRGPVIYCLESPDLPAHTDILDVYIPSDIKLQPSHQPDFLDGMTTLAGQVWLRGDQRTAMYSPLIKPDWKQVDTQFVPYFAWSNRGVSEMTVWLPIIWR